MTQQELTNIEDMEFAMAKLHTALMNIPQRCIYKDILKAMEHLDLALEHYEKLVGRG